jgi:hypothetical protein
MAEAEQQKTTDPELWREPVLALIENARRAELLGAADDDGTVANSRLRQLRRDWRNYLRLIRETLRGSSDPVAHAIRDARRRLSGRPGSLEPSRQKWKEIGQLNSVTTDPEELERWSNAAEREHNLQVYERRLKDAMRDELRSGRWEGEDLAGPIPDRIWSLPQLDIDWGNATIRIAEEPLRYGLQLRPRRVVGVSLDRVAAAVYYLHWARAATR